MRIRCLCGAAIGFLRSKGLITSRLCVARNRLGIGRGSNTIPLGPSKSLGLGKTATTGPTPFCGRATTSPIFARERLRVVTLQNGDRCDRNRKHGRAKENQDNESRNFPSNGVQPIFRRKSLQLTVDPRWSTESVTWPGPLSTPRMISNRAPVTSFQEALRQSNSSPLYLFCSNGWRLDLQTSRIFVREFKSATLCFR